MQDRLEEVEFSASWKGKEYGNRRAEKVHSSLNSICHTCTTCDVIATI